MIVESSGGSTDAGVTELYQASGVQSTGLRSNAQRQTSPPFSGTASILAWFGIYPRSAGERTLTANWQGDTITTEVTASLGPRGGISSPEEGQGLQYRRYDQVSGEEQTGVIRADGMMHTITLPGGDPETVRDKDAAAKIYRDLGSAAVTFTVPRSGYEQRT